MVMNDRQQELQVYQLIFLNPGGWTTLFLYQHIQNRSYDQNRIAIFSGLVFDRDRDRDRSSKFGIRL
jgi:hypothetical protein